MATGGNSRARKPSESFNWLEGLDRTIKDLPDGWNLDFERCPLFMMTRYPRLMGWLSKKVIDGNIAHWERQISEDRSTQCVLGGLDDHQRKQWPRYSWTQLRH
jgi:hypothetical protein